MDSTRDADVVVIGAGIGGLMAAACLQSLGRRCIVVDRHSIVGGNVSVFEHSGFEFDVGTHYVGDCEPGGLVPSMYESLGLGDAITWRPLDRDCFDRYYFPDATYDIPTGVDNYRTRLCEWFPGERAGIDAFCDFVSDVDEALGDSLAGKMSEKAAVLFSHRDTTIGELFDTWDLSPRLRAVLGAQHALYGVGPARAAALIHALVVMHYMKGAYYPEGGGQLLSDTLADCIRDRGGEVFLQTPVESVIVEGGQARGVTLRPPTPLRERGVPTEIRAPVVLSNADLKRTVLSLVGREHFPADFVGRIEALRMGPPLAIAYVVIDRDLAAEGHPNANAFIVAGDDADAEYEAIASGEMLDDPTVFISFASLKDPTNTRLCRPGQTNLEIMALTPGDHAYWGLERGPVAGERYRTNDVYRRRKQEIVDMLVDRAETVIPGLRDSLVHLEGATAITHERFVRSSGGTSYGFEVTPDQLLDRRPAPVSPLPGLYFTGQGITTGHGIASCMAGGVMSAGAITGMPLLQMMRNGESLAGTSAGSAVGG
ncbi:MAG: NAD(P)/FAD-dependent oxidoreductase [Actinobacteria bacterium ATB1]|nr:NAD(P)/FAD-dependent oxidoreductase [Actinobacteria bacterium ATB1]